MAWLIKSNPVLPVVALIAAVAVAADGTDDGADADAASLVDPLAGIDDEERSVIPTEFCRSL